MKKLEVSDIYNKIEHRINEGMGMFLAISFYDLLEWEFDFDIYLEKYKCNLQRGYIWTDKQKSEFLISCIKGITSGMTPFCLLEDRSNGRKVEVIDGKQRLLTLIGLLKGEVFIEFNGDKYYRDDLSKECKYKISRHGIKSNIGFIYDGWTDDDKLNWFKNVNFSGTPVDKKHLEKFNLK